MWLDVPLMISGVSRDSGEENEVLTPSFLTMGLFVVAWTSTTFYGGGGGGIFQEDCSESAGGYCAGSDTTRRDVKMGYVVAL